MKAILTEITRDQLKDHRSNFKVGDGVKVHTRVREGDKERIQVFAGIVIALRGTGIATTFTVRRIASGVGVERVFPLHSPNIEKIELDRESVVGRSRMYYLRDRIGKAATKVNEKDYMDTAVGIAATKAAATKAATKAAEPKAEKVEKAEKPAAKKAAKAEKKD